MSALFAGMGVALPYLGRWLEVERGLNGAEIGAVLSLAQLTRVVIGPAIGFWSDGAADRRMPVRLVALIAAIAYAAFFFLAHDFWSLLVLGFIALTLTQALNPLIEAATLRATAEGRMSYGVARGIGSAAFIVANVLGGVLMARFGAGAVAWWVVGAYIACALSAWTHLPPEPAPGDAAHRTVAARYGAVGALLRDRRFVLLIVSCGLIQASHAFFYGFSVLVWRGQGVGADLIGVLWAFGVAVEVAFLWTLPWFERRATPEALILLGAIGGVVRWTALGFAPLGWVLWPLQALHALTFAATHVGAMRLLFRDTPDNAAGAAQTLYSALSGGLLLGVATLGSGVLYDFGGAIGYWAMAAMAGLGALVALALARTPARRIS